MRVRHIFRRIFNVPASVDGQRATTLGRDGGPEVLEARIAPATIVNASTLTYQDVDGDIVTLKFSKPLLSSNSVANGFLTFDTGSVDDTNNVAQQLQLIKLSALTAAGVNPAAGVSITVTALKADSGDGLVDVGAINATGLVLGTVKISGDLGQIDAGSNASAMAINTLDVGSMGVRGVSTQAGSPSLVSNIVGGLGKVTVATDIQGASIFTVNGAADGTGKITAVAKIGSVTIGRDLLGEPAVNSSSDLTGLISSTGAIGSVNIGRDLVGGGGENSGAIVAGQIKKLAIGRDLTGGGGSNSGVITVERDLGSLTVTGNVSGGSGLNSGAVVAWGKMNSASIGGSLIGGAGANSGALFSGFAGTQVGDMGAVKVGVAMLGGGGDNSGVIYSGGQIKSVTIGGLLTATNNNGDALRGGSGANSGSISSEGSVGSIVLAGHLQGGDGIQSGVVLVNGKLGSLSVGGNITGGNGISSGSATILDSGVTAGSLGKLTVTGALGAGAGADSGAIRVDGGLGTATIGSIAGTNTQGTGFIGTGLGTVESGKVSAIKVAGDVSGARVQVGGKLTVFSAEGAISSSTIRAGFDLGTLSAASLSDSEISARGQEIQGKSSDVAIKLVKISGAVSGSLILAGYDLSGTGVNPDAQIGTIAVGGDWTASSVAAGVEDTLDDGIGDSGDSVLAGSDAAGIVSRIASVVISGAVTGTVSGGDHFGFVAQLVGSFKVGSQTLALSTAQGLQVLELDSTNNDVTVRELA